jgi:hypothetical protein
MTSIDDKLLDGLVLDAQRYRWLRGETVAIDLGQTVVRYTDPKELDKVCDAGSANALREYYQQLDRDTGSGLAYAELVRRGQGNQ